MTALRLHDRPAPRPDEAGMGPAPGHPFELADEATYRCWRAWKLRHRAHDASDLVVELTDPRALTGAERELLLAQIARRGCAVYRSPHIEADKSLPRRLGAQLGLRALDANWLADEDGISSIEVDDAGATAGTGRTDFIPYTDRAIRWHTDGYYHPEERRIRGMILHCVRAADQGGATRLLDPELAYIALRDESPAFVRALLHPGAMTIPARLGDAGVARAAQSGPVFSVCRDGAATHLHLRYTARTRSIEWRDDEITRAAVAWFAAWLDDPRSGALELRLGPGMGVVGHNVLHERRAFTDDPARPRLLYRARFLERIASAHDEAWR